MIKHVMIVGVVTVPVVMVGGRRICALVVVDLIRHLRKLCCGHADHLLRSDRFVHLTCQWRGVGPSPPLMGVGWLCFFCGVGGFFLLSKGVTPGGPAGGFGS